MRGSSAFFLLLPAVAAAASRLNATTLRTPTPHDAEARHRRLLSDGVSVRATQTQKIIASDVAAFAYFGGSVAVSGSYLVVGANGDDVAASFSGSVYIYNMTDDGLWEFMQKIVAPDGAREDFFGDAVAVSGHHLVVGAPEDNDDAGVDQGSVYCYTLTDGSATWNFIQKIVAPDAEAHDLFGKSVALSGNHLVVGAPFDDDDDDGEDAGSVYLYSLTDGGAWHYVQKLVASDATAYARFGHAVAISGNHLVVGSPGDSAVYIFRTSDSGDSWVQILKVVSDEVPDDRDDAPYYSDRSDFGRSVAIDGNTIVVGALYDSSASTEAGAAYVFILSEGLWTQAQKIVAPDAAVNDCFGYSVVVSGDTVVVGARGDDDAGSSSGSAYLYRNNGTTWDYVYKLVASDATAHAFFGTSVALSSGNLLVGAQGDDDRRGSMYIYALEYCAEMAMSDAAGNGWNGAYYAITSVTSGEVVVAGTLALGSSGSDEVCLLGGCYALEVIGGGDFDQDISWTFVDIAGGAPYGPTGLDVNGDIFESPNCTSSLYEDTSDGGSSGNSNGTSVGMIVGVVVGVLAGLATLVFLSYQAYRAYQESQNSDETFCELWCENMRVNIMCGCCNSTTNDTGQQKRRQDHQPNNRRGAHGAVVGNTTNNHAGNYTPAEVDAGVQRAEDEGRNKRRRR